MSDHREIGALKNCTQPFRQWFYVGPEEDFDRLKLNRLADDDIPGSGYGHLFDLLPQPWKEERAKQLIEAHDTYDAALDEALARSGGCSFPGRHGRDVRDFCVNV